MNHDYSHCLDYKESCPKKCFRAELVRDLKSRKDMVGVPLSWVHFEGTNYCPKVKRKEHETGRLIDADRLLKGKEDHDRISTHVIWNAPTVEAIPVEWIKKYMSRCLAIEQDAIGEMVKELAERKDE